MQLKSGIVNSQTLFLYFTKKNRETFYWFSCQKSFLFIIITSMTKYSPCKSSFKVQKLKSERNLTKGYRKERERKIQKIEAKIWIIVASSRHSFEAIEKYPQAASKFPALPKFLYDLFVLRNLQLSVVSCSFCKCQFPFRWNSPTKTWRLQIVHGYKQYEVEYIHLD